jgi:hypothetical protein
LRKIEAEERWPSKELAVMLDKGLEVILEDQTTFVKVARGELGVEKLPTRGSETQLFVKSGPPAARHAMFAADHRRAGGNRPDILDHHRPSRRTGRWAGHGLSGWSQCYQCRISSIPPDCYELCGGNKVPDQRSCMGREEMAVGVRNYG